jgi:superfamily II DNA or RNA helicase
MSQSVTIEIINPIICKIFPHKEIRCAKDLAYKKEYWKKKTYGRERIEYDAFIIDTKGIFLTGHLDKIKTYCEQNNYEVTILNQPIKSAFNPPLELPGITYRNDQIKLINTALLSGRGVLKSPTGSGKTVIACGIMSSFTNSNILFLCHTVDLVKQTIDELKKFNLGPVTQVGDGKKDMSGRIVVATMQSLSNMDIDEYSNRFDVVFVDEAHHISSFTGTYAKLLSVIFSPIRFGLTATLSNKLESLLAMEGFIGPVIGEVTINDGMKEKFLAKPIIKLIKVPKNTDVTILKKYSEIYDEAIVTYRQRNRIILDEARKLNNDNKSVLIYVNKIEHGERLISIAEILGMKVYFVRGEVSGDERESLKKKLINKEILTVVATTVWKEGVNIKSLNAIFIAGGGKSELGLIQTIGRGLRIDIDKIEMLIVDFLDSGKYLSEHCIERLGVYVENGWI